MSHSVQTTDFHALWQANISFFMKKSDTFQAYLQIPDQSSKECTKIYKSTIKLLQDIRETIKNISKEFTKRELRQLQSVDAMNNIIQVHNAAQKYLLMEDCMKIIEKEIIKTIMEFHTRVPINQRSTVYKIHRPPNIQDTFSLREILALFEEQLNLKEEQEIPNPDFNSAYSFPLKRRHSEPINIHN